MLNQQSPPVDHVSDGPDDRHTPCLAIPSTSSLRYHRSMSQVFKTAGSAVGPGTSAHDRRAGTVASTHRFRDRHIQRRTRRVPSRRTRAPARWLAGPSVLYVAFSRPRHKNSGAVEHAYPKGRMLRVRGMSGPSVGATPRPTAEVLTTLLRLEHIPSIQGRCSGRCQTAASEVRALMFHSPLPVVR